MFLSLKSKKIVGEVIKITIVIDKIKVDSNFKYLWLKYINGVNLKTHCANCLKGHYSKQINSNLKYGENIFLNEFSGKYYYLCGVTEPYKWENNFHLAFLEKEGKQIDIEENGIKITLTNAERIEINTDYIDENDEYAQLEEYYTCRNWQFANYIKDKL